MRVVFKTPRHLDSWQRGEFSFKRRPKHTDVYYQLSNINDLHAGSFVARDPTDPSVPTSQSGESSKDLTLIYRTDHFAGFSRVGSFCAAAAPALSRQTATDPRPQLEGKGCQGAVIVSLKKKVYDTKSAGGACDRCQVRFHLNPVARLDYNQIWAKRGTSVTTVDAVLQNVNTSTLTFPLAI